MTAEKKAHPVRQLSRGLKIGLLISLVFVLVFPLFFQISGRWPGETITVANTDPAWAEVLLNAIEHWNQADIGIQFEVTSDYANADVLVSSGDVSKVCGGADEVACASRTGWVVGSPQTTITFPSIDSPIGTLISSGDATQTMAHELGHVLGLEHRDGCSIMNTQPITGCDSGTQQNIEYRFGKWRPDLAACSGEYLVSPELIREYCPRQTPLTYICGPLNEDIEAARQLYGGNGPTRDYNPFCTILWRQEPIHMNEQD